MTDHPMSQADRTAIATTLLRVASGALLLTHGLTKLIVFTPAGTAAFFESIGFPGFTAYPVMAGEIGLGLAMILGVWPRLAALAALPILLGSIIPHAGNGFTFSNAGGGWEFPAFWSAVLVVQALLGDGTLALSRGLAPAKG